MNAASINRTLPGFIADTQSITDQVQAAFGGLSAQQLNWKPGPDRWSVGQCLEHLITTNTAYFASFEAIIAGTHQPPLWSYIPFMTGMWGRMIIGIVDPDNTKKASAPSSFQPATSQVDPGIIQTFADHQGRLVSYLKRLEGKNLADFVITSPAASFITVSLADACTTIVLHEQRHVNQAVRVTKTDGFPGA